MKIALFAAIAALLGAATAQAATPAVTDLTGDFIEVFDATVGLPRAARVPAFEQRMATLFPGFYTAARVGISATTYDATIARAFDRFSGIRPAYTARAAAFAPQLADARTSFGAAFPDAKALPPTYLLHSLGEMDGGTRTIGGRTVLIFGADVIAQVHDFANERPFFHHELFHTYHEPLLGPCDALWCAVWTEGLATYVAARLNPGASDSELLLTSPRPLRAAVEGNREAAVCAVLRSAASTASDEYDPLFTGGKSLPGLPPRAGYYVGYLVAQKLGKSATLTELAHLDAKAAQPRVLAALQALAPDCAKP